MYYYLYYLTWVLSEMLEIPLKEVFSSTLSRTANSAPHLFVNESSLLLILPFLLVHFAQQHYFV